MWPCYVYGPLFQRARKKLDHNIGAVRKGPSINIMIKDVRSRGGRGVSQKWTLAADAGGGGLMWQSKMRTSSKFKYLPKFSTFI